MSLQQLADYCQQHVNIKQDSQKIEEAGIANVRRIWKSPASTNKNHYRKNSPLSRRNWKSSSSTNKNHEKKTLLPHAMDVDNSTGTRTARTSTKFVETATERDIKCRVVKKIKQSRVKITQIDNQEQNIRKYLYVKIQIKKVKMQLDSGSDISIINTQIGKILGNQHTLSPTKSPEPWQAEK